MSVTIAALMALGGPGEEPVGADLLLQPNIKKATAKAARIDRMFAPRFQFLGNMGFCAGSEALEVSNCSSAMAVIP
jgi:hypothetical protein